MDILFRQLRTKYPGDIQEAEEGSRHIMEQKIPPQRTQSFKGEKKGSQSWIKRQFSRQTSQDDDSNLMGNYPAAVAAAAFAIKSNEETKVGDDKKERHSRDTSLTKIKSKVDETARVPEPQPRTRSTKFSDEIANQNPHVPDKGLQKSAEPIEKIPEKSLGLIPSIKKKLSFADTSSPEATLPAEKTIRPAPSIKNAPTFGDTNLERTPSRKPGIAEQKPDFAPPIQPQFQAADTRRPSPNKLSTGDSEADAWEKAEMAKIREKYEKLNKNILDWQNKRKEKAKRKLEKTEAELDKRRAKADKRRAKAMQHYHSKLSRIDGIVGGAQSQASENRRNEEFKAKEKANKIRLTGKFPGTRLCC